MELWPAGPRRCHVGQPQIATGILTSRYSTAAAMGTVTEVPRAQGRTALPSAVRPEKQ